jgi:hypothetical protein
LFPFLRTGAESIFSAEHTEDYGEGFHQKSTAALSPRQLCATSCFIAVLGDDMKPTSASAGRPGRSRALQVDEN